MKSNDDYRNPFVIPTIAIIATLLIGFGSIGGLIFSVVDARMNAVETILDSRLSSMESKLDAVIERYDRRFDEMDKKLDSVKADQNQTSQNLTDHLQLHN